jgi:hypothetical protein
VFTDIKFLPEYQQELACLPNNNERAFARSRAQGNQHHSCEASSTSYPNPKQSLNYSSVANLYLGPSFHPRPIQSLYSRPCNTTSTTIAKWEGNSKSNSLLLLKWESRAKNAKQPTLKDQITPPKPAAPSDDQLRTSHLISSQLLPKNTNSTRERRGEKKMRVFTHEKRRRGHNQKKKKRKNKKKTCLSALRSFAGEICFP